MKRLQNNSTETIILCGPPNAGKTTLGRLLAEKLGWSFIDTDLLIEKEIGKSCREFYREMGEKAFRAVESQVVKSLEMGSFCVIALGGGALLCPNNMSHLKSLGKLVYVKATTPVLLDRMKNEWPAYVTNQKRFEDLVVEREPLYENNADYVITNVQYDLEGVKRLCDELIDWILNGVGQDGK